MKEETTEKGKKEKVETPMQSVETPEQGAETPKQKVEPQKQAVEEAPTLQEVIREQAIEDEAPMSKNFTLRKILGGDILTTQAMRRQIWLFLLITLFIIVYISNRYSCQKDLIEIDQLQKELQDAKYKALSTSSQLTEKSRESRVLELLQNNKDSLLKIPNQPAYIIQVEE